MPSNQEVLTTIPDSVMGSFSSGRFRIGCSCLLSLFCTVLFSSETPVDHSSVEVHQFCLYVVHSNFLQCRALACKSLVTVEIKIKKEEGEKQNYLRIPLTR